MVKGALRCVFLTYHFHAHDLCHFGWSMSLKSTPPLNAIST